MCCIVSEASKCADFHFKAHKKLVYKSAHGEDNVLWKWRRRRSIVIGETNQKKLNIGLKRSDQCRQTVYLKLSFKNYK